MTAFLACLKALSALVFLLGVLAMLVAFIGMWLYVGTHAVKTHWLIGLAYLVGTFVLAPRGEHAIRVPFGMWFEIWSWADDRITGRERP